MSSNLPSIDLTGATVGTIFSQDFPQFVTIDPKNLATANIRYYNESGAGLSARTNTGYEFKIPAGAWPTIKIGPKDTHIDFTVSYVLPNAPVSLLEATYFAPGEDPTPAPPLGNSPIGITGGVQTSSVQTLSNEGNAAGTQVIDIGDAAFANLFRLFTDGHCTWSVDQTGTAHQVINIQTSGVPLQLGKSGDTTEILGTLQVDSGVNTGTIRDNTTGAVQATLVTAGISFNNITTHSGGIILGTGANDFLESGDNSTKILDCTSGSNIFINPPGTGAGKVVGLATNGVERFEANDSGVSLKSGTFNFLAGTISRTWGGNVGCGSGTTISHGAGVVPDLVVATPNIAQPGSATVGIGALTSTNFRATVGAGTQICFFVSKG